MDEVNFLNEALSSSSLCWDEGSVRNLSRLQVPDVLLGQQGAILKADIKHQWARWFVESFVDPWRYFNYDITYPDLFYEVYQIIRIRFSHYSDPQKKELSSITARILLNTIYSMKVRKKRDAITYNDKKYLLDISGSPPRCWICGMKFSENAILNYLNNSSYEIVLPNFIDIFKPIGLFRKDMSIEIDHILAVAEGGQSDDNLALACGWCNRHKSSLTSIYEIGGKAVRAGRNNIGVESIPNPFWTVRLLALNKECEHYEGCINSSDNNQMTVSPVTKGGAINPANLKVTCYDHDLLKDIRFQPQHIVKNIWLKNK